VPVQESSSQERVPEQRQAKPEVTKVEFDKQEELPELKVETEQMQMKEITDVEVHAEQDYEQQNQKVD